MKRHSLIQNLIPRILLTTSSSWNTANCDQMQSVQEVQEQQSHELACQKSLVTNPVLQKNKWDNEKKGKLQFWSMNIFPIHLRFRFTMEHLALVALSDLFFYVRLQISLLKIIYCHCIFDCLVLIRISRDTIDRGLKCSGKIRQNCPS